MDRTLTGFRHDFGEVLCLRRQMGFVVGQISVCGQGQNSTLRRSTYRAKSCERDYEPICYLDHRHIFCPDRCQARLGHVLKAVGEQGPQTDPFSPQKQLQPAVRMVRLGRLGLGLLIYLGCRESGALE